MKVNKLLVGILSVSALLLSGCGAKKKNLVCTQKAYEGATVKYDLTYTGKSASKVVFSYDFNYEGYSESSIAEAKKTITCDYVKNIMSQYNVINCKDNYSDKHIKISAELDKSYFKGIKIDDAKKQIESLRFTCNIEK